MAYAFVQQNASDNAAAATTITVTLTPTAGNLLVFALSGDSLDTTSIALSDNLGTPNTFTQISTDLVALSTQRCAWWFAANCKGGATTFTATYSGSTRFRTIYVAEYSGVATTSPFLNGARADNIVPGTGTDAVSSGSANATSQPALVWGFGFDVDGGSTPSAGTGFTSRAGVWSAATSLGRPEDKRVTATGNVAATFTAGTGTDDHVAGVGVFAEAVAVTPPLSWQPSFADRVPPRPPVSALGVAVAPVLAIALSPLTWGPTFPDNAPGRPAPNLATGSAAEPVLVPPTAPPVVPLSWAPSFPDQLRRAPAPLVPSGQAAPEATLPNPPAPALSWQPSFPDSAPRARAALPASGQIAPVAPNPVPSLTSWVALSESPPRGWRSQAVSGTAGPVLPIPNLGPSIFPLTVSSNGRHLRKSDGTPFLVCADSTWSLLVNVPLTGASTYSTYFSTLTSQGFTALMGNAIEHHFTTVKPPKERGGLLPFTQRMDGSAYTGSPNGTANPAGTQGQFAADNYSSPSTQSPDPTFINNAYWLAVEQVLDSALANNLAVFVWPSYLGFHAGDEGWMGEMVVWDSVTGAGGFTGQSFADPTKSKMWNYGAWLAARWKNYPNIVWMMGGDYGSGGQPLTTPERAAVVNLVGGLKSVAGQRSLLFAAHWERPAISDDNLIAGVTWDLNFDYCDEAVAELCRRAYSTAAKPSILGEYNYEDGLFGGSVPWRKYTWWGFLGGIAGGFYGHEQLWRFDDGTPGTDWTTLLATQARLDVVRQFAFMKARPWHRLVPNGLGGIGTLITAGGGTASPQSTDYVAAAATPERDLLLAYVPPAHTGSVTVDMTKLGASITARWFDPANATFTSIGTFANTGTHAFTTPGNNSAGDADWLLVLDAPDAPMPLSWNPSFPDRCLRQSLGLAQVVSGVVKPVAPPPPPTLANWSPDFPDSAPPARQPVNTGGAAAPVATLPDPVPLSWVPSFPNRLTPAASRPHDGLVAPPADTNAGPLTWLSSFPDRAHGPGRAPAGGAFAPPLDTNAGPLTWLPRTPDLPSRPRFQPPEGMSAPLLIVSITPVVPLSWSPGFPSLTLRARQPIVVGGTTQPEATLPNTPAVPLSWSPRFPDLAPRARQPIIVGGATQPEATLPSAPAPFWNPSFPDRVSLPLPRVHVGGTTAPPTDANAGPLTWLSQIPSPISGPRVSPQGGEFAPPPVIVLPLSWAPAFPDAALRLRRSINTGGMTKPEATLPNPPAPSLSWAPAFPAFAPRALQPVNMGGMIGPEATIPNPPAPPLSWGPEFPDFALRPSQPINTGGMIGPVAPNLVTPRTTPPGRAPAQLVGHVTTRFVESRQDEDAHLYGTVRRKRDV